ncbi:transcription factor PIF3-like isoform X2 [Abrus precatorius]|uniref:Transcription factor PIF3-like isoform X2 n=1 Tax=Abrus precatorius TaxID=3816 RepID=A0A8B8L874_ABRPR|nr:transcription factor PIF3-like isoform X2 [Abrus precatorius]
MRSKSTKRRVVEEIEARKVEKASAEGSHGLTGFQKQTSFVERRPEAPLDEHSEAVGNNSCGLGIHRSNTQRCNQTSSSGALGAKGKANTNLCNEPLLASPSVCSLGASNDPNLAIRLHEDTDDPAYLSDNDEEAEDLLQQTPDREGNRIKRSRNAEVHNLSEKKRRERINKKMRTLKELIPNCNKVDKASMLDDAIDYLKTLKLQLQIMSMGSGLWPLMMLPAAAHHINGPHLPQLMGAGMGFRPPQLPIPLPIPPLSASAITNNRFQMFGFPNQIPPMPIPHAPYFPIIGNSSTTQPHLATSPTATTNLREHLANSSTPQVAIPNNINSDFHAKVQNAVKQVPNQVSLHHHNTSPLAIPFIFPQR